MAGRRPTIFIEHGTRFGKLTAIEETKNKGRRAILCLCDCGNHKVINIAALVSNSVSSCGCLRSELARTRASERNKTNPPRLGTGKDSKSSSQYLIDDNGRECAGKYCGHEYKPWSEFNKGNSAKGHNSWCRDCTKTHYNVKQGAR